MFACSFSIPTFRHLLSFPVNFAFSPPSMCIFSSVGVGDFSHCFKQTGRTILDFALVPFSSFYVECHHLIVNLQSTPLGYLVATCLCASGHWRKFVSQNQNQNGDCKGISSHPSNNSSEKSWSICMSIFYGQIS